MGYEIRLFSLLFFVAFAVYLFFGTYIFSKNPRGRLNCMLLAVYASLCFWALGYSMANAAPDPESCLFWQRLAAVGWSAIPAVALHFLLLLSRKDGSVDFKVTDWLLYLPTVIAVYVFALSGETTTAQYNPVMTDLGWINIDIKNGWSLFYLIYFASYGLACLAIMRKWKRRTENQLMQGMASTFLMAIVVTLLLAVTTDVIMNIYMANPPPQMAPLFFLLPTVAAYYGINKYGLLPVREEADPIFTSTTRTKMYYYLAVGFMVGGLLNFLTHFFDYLVPSPEAVSSRMFASLLLLFLGVAVLLFQSIKDDRVKTPLVLVTMLLSIPVVTFQFIWFSGITIWVMPLLLMMIALTFNSRTPLILITVVAIVTQLVMWQRPPEGDLKIDEFDFVIRMGIFLIAFWIGSFINKTYIDRYRENIYQYNFQKLISEISFDFVNIDQDNINEKVNEMLEKIGRFFEADHTYVFLSDRRDSMVYVYEWCDETISLKTEMYRKFPMEAFPWWMGQLKDNKMIRLPDVEMLPPEASAEREQLMRHGIKSTVVIPIEGDGTLLGFIGLNCIRSGDKWSGFHIEPLRILANLLADGVIKTLAKAEVEYMAYYDHLTGLPNRILFADRLSQAINLAQRNNKFVGIIFIDLDSFKMVNDTMGHSAGDTMLKTVARALTKRLRKTDTVARFGGDEFLVLANNLQNSWDIVTVADNIMKIFEEPFEVQGHEFFITCSAGVAVYPLDGEDAGTLIKNADIAMYTAKSSGKNQYAMCTSEMKEEVQKNILISNYLYRVQERNELMVYYQPQISLQTGLMVGLEALLRWNHPEMGMIPPNVFIPLAEMNGTINSIGEWVLKTSINQNKRWQDMGFPPLRMAVNLSVIQFSNPNFVESLAGILSEAGLDPKYLELEITESIATKEADHIINTLEGLKKLGVSISIDDFGTEYSSLNRLKMLPIDRIKIDMQFVQGIESSEKDRAITKVVINLAQSLGLKVLAEGVETELQLDFLNHRMCDEVQGYYYYKPMPAEEIEKLFRQFAQK